MTVAADTVEITPIDEHDDLWPPACEWCGAEGRYEGPEDICATTVCSARCAARYYRVLPSSVSIKEADHE